MPQNKYNLINLNKISDPPSSNSFNLHETSALLAGVMALLDDRKCESLRLSLEMQRDGVHEDSEVDFTCKKYENA